jgi:prephenate dehydrogenase
MWKDIALANREALLASLDEFNAHLLTLRAAIDTADAEALLATFTRAKTARDDFASSTAERDAP